MDILARTPDTHAGRHTRWLWSRLLGIAAGSPPPTPAELAEHFAPSVFQQVSADQLIALLARLAPAMPLVTKLLEETSSDERYTALLSLPTGWLRYMCLAQDDEPYLIIAAACTSALDPSSYSDQRVERDGRGVHIRDFGGDGPLMLLWHGAGGACTNWETLVPHLADFRCIAQDLPGHGRSPLKVFTTGDALADADAVVADLDEGPPTIVGHSLGGYLGLRYAATRTCAGWIGLDGPLGIVYPWDLDDPGFSETSRQIGREIIAIDVARDLTAIDCPAMLLLSAIAANPIEQRMVAARRELAEHIALHHPKIRIQHVQSGHDAMIYAPETAALIRDFLIRA
jgi:pimeloyl-ACP methyl ester carboxylesterase